MIHAIFAMDRMGGFGQSGRYPWPMTATYQKWFSELVKNQVLVAGHNAWQLLVKNSLVPWSRYNYVASRHSVNSDVHVVSGDLVQEIKIIQAAHPDLEIFIAGGKTILESTRHIIDQMHIAHVHGQYQADARLFPGYFLSGFQTTRVTPTQDRSFTFMTYQNLFSL